MTGLDPAIATLLASRFELLLSAIRPAAGATAGQTTMQAGTSRLFVDIQSGTAASAQNNASAGAGPSAQTALSSVARTLDAISRFGGGGTPPLTGETPLWPTAPRPASAFATLSGGLFDTAFASNPLSAAAQASAARALGQPAPPLPASALAVALAKTVGDSGLFYESHLVEWLAGQRPAASLADEPQARVDPDALALALEVPDQPAASDAWLDDPAAPRALRNLADPPDLQAPVHTVALPRNPQQAAALAESVRDAPVSVFSAAPPVVPAPAEMPQASAMRAALLAGVHPSTIPLVRQQLEVLATDQFRWSGDPEAERPWRTRVTLSLPTLGTVDADLVLTGQKLVARINASAHGAARLAADGDAFRQQLAAAGIGLAGLSIRAVDGSLDGEADSLAAGGNGRAARKPVASPLEHLFRAPPAAKGAGS